LGTERCSRREKLRSEIGSKKGKTETQQQDGDGAGKEEQATCGFQRQLKVGGRNLGRSDREEAGY
jgi:hypothetical protein